ncbi:MAG: ATP-binding protein [Rickettsiales bacterium]|nr:ATP-binding protein [Rickettsiales bacterium]
MSGAYLNALPSAVIAIDSNRHIHFINYATNLLFEIKDTFVLGKPLSLLMDLTDTEQTMLDRVFASSQEVSLYERPLITPQGTIHINMHMSPVVQNDGTVTQALITVEKQTGLTDTYASEWKKEATRTAGIMAAMLAHEVKNPLSGIRGAAQFLKDEIAAEHQPLLDLICSETDRIRDLVNQVEIFSAGAPEKEALNIHEVLQYVISLASAGVAKHVVFKEQYDPSLPLVMGHRDLLIQLFLNLIKNAAEALEGRLNPTITLSSTYRSGYRIRSQHNNEPLSLPIIISIEDNGPGIDEAARPHLFEPFVSSKEDGRGLGLAIVAKIASDLGAVAELGESKSGTRFNVLLACAT